MIKVINEETLVEAAKLFEPKFIRVDNVDVCADKINKPHEDYPQFVEATKESILYMVQAIIDDKTRELIPSDLKLVHAFCMKEKHNIVRGDWRDKFGVEIKGADITPPEPMLIYDLVKSIMPLQVEITDEELIDWYRLFQTIHPFEDGNGRVGAIIVAALSSLNHGEFLTPEQI